MENKVLVVDDDELVLACFKRMLSRHFDLDTASGPYEALDTISKKGPYAVVLSDMRMPRLNGIQFLAKAKEIAPETVGVLLSGNFDYSDLESIDQNIVFKVIDKPCPYDELIGFVQEALTHYHNNLRE